MTLLEATAVVFGIACVILTIRQHMACWPTGLVMVVLYIQIFYEARLFSEMALQIVSRVSGYKCNNINWLELWDSKILQSVSVSS